MELGCESAKTTVLSAGTWGKYYLACYNTNSAYWTRSTASKISAAAVKSCTLLAGGPSVPCTQNGQQGGQTYPRSLTGNVARSSPVIGGNYQTSGCKQKEKALCCADAERMETIG
jgi:hypothetical protein